MDLLELQKKLEAPFTKVVNGKTFSNLRWLPKNSTKNKDKICCYPYLDRSLVIDRLNECFGLDGWNFSVKREDDGSRTGEISIKVNGDWISRSDTGTESNYDGKGKKLDKTDKEKAATSDALKRAATLFGIGTYLYDTPPKWIPAFVAGNGKAQPCDNKKKALYGDQLHNYCNGMSSARGILYQLFTFDPTIYDIPEAKKLWETL